jgi:hypothetical protein
MLTMPMDFKNKIHSVESVTEKLELSTVNLQAKFNQNRAPFFAPLDEN